MRKLLLLITLIALPSFAEVPPDAARLSWQAPTERTDDTPLAPNELAGYEVFWGTSPNASELSEMVFVDAAVTQYMVTELTEGTWYFAVKAVDTDDRRSDFSTVASKVIEPLEEPPPVDPPQDPDRIGIR